MARREGVKFLQKKDHGAWDYLSRKEPLAQPPNPTSGFSEVPFGRLPKNGKREAQNEARARGEYYSQQPYWTAGIDSLVTAAEVSFRWLT